VSAVKRIVPAFVCTSATMEESGLTALDESIPNDFEYYLDDLPTADGLPMEVDNWTNKWRRFKGNLPDNPADCLSHAAPAFYPNIHCLLSIFCTLPVTTAECERSVSVLRRLKLYLRSSMGQERPSSLAILHINYSMEINLDAVVKLP
jgi:hypothetical protein